MDQGVLYLYLGEGLEVPFTSPEKERLKTSYPNHYHHDIDLGADALTWHYTHDWLRLMDEVILVVEGSEIGGELSLGKKAVAQLLQYRKKLQVHFTESATQSPYYAAFKPLERYRV